MYNQNNYSSKGHSAPSSYGHSNFATVYNRPSGIKELFENLIIVVMLFFGFMFFLRKKKDVDNETNDNTNSDNTNNDNNTFVDDNTDKLTIVNDVNTELIRLDWYNYCAAIANPTIKNSTCLGMLTSMYQKYSNVLILAGAKKLNENYGFPFYYYASNTKHIYDCMQKYLSAASLSMHLLKIDVTTKNYLMNYVN